MNRINTHPTILLKEDPFFLAFLLSSIIDKGSQMQNLLKFILNDSKIRAFNLLCQFKF